ncbi:MAG: hypothetical protein JST40_01900 [Armatimonadetes bacterium]|nr:hypothetical protein [Armatimonadota bacterium]
MVLAAALWVLLGTDHELNLPFLQRLVSSKIIYSKEKSGDGHWGEFWLRKNGTWVGRSNGYELEYVGGGSHPKARKRGTAKWNKLLQQPCKRGTELGRVLDWYKEPASISRDGEGMPDDNGFITWGGRRVRTICAWGIHGEPMQGATTIILEKGSGRPYVFISEDFGIFTDDPTESHPTKEVTYFSQIQINAKWPKWAANF